MTPKLATSPSDFKSCNPLKTVYRKIKKNTFKKK